MKKSALSVFVLLCISITWNGASIVKGESQTRTVTDMLGREVDIPQEVDEVVGIEAGALRLLVYMEAKDMVVGVEEFEKRDGNRPYIMANPELQNKTSIGPQHGGDAELITSQDPDVIFWTYTTGGKADELQEKTGIPVIALNYGDLNEKRGTFYSALDLIGNVLKKERRTDELKDFFNRTIEDLDERTKDVPSDQKPRCYVGGIGHKGPHGIKSTEPDYSPFEFVNAKNTAGELETDHAMVDPEQIIEWNPEIIFVDEAGYGLVKKNLKNSSEYSTIDAVENSELYGVLPYNYYTTNYGTILANSYYIGSVLYEDRFDDIDLEEKVNQIYQKLVGEGVYDEMNDSFGGYKNLNIDIGSDGNISWYVPFAVGVVISFGFIFYYQKRKKR
ncbi:MAG: iron ABC transporter substrate-binding protein [Candidatus Thermoplasmatota archaeon]|nr:iron ABC transporter substrate-binding protein [Candidatus Thermoplasmatota archaeon]